jgi:hypothetical protein
MNDLSYSLHVNFLVARPDGSSLDLPSGTTDHLLTSTQVAQYLFGVREHFAEQQINVEWQAARHWIFGVTHATIAGTVTFQPDEIEAAELLAGFADLVSLRSSFDEGLCANPEVRTVDSRLKFKPFPLNSSRADSPVVFLLASVERGTVQELFSEVSPF